MAIFGGLMALVETLNSLGVSLSANPSSSPEQQKLGSHLAVAAIVIQLGLIFTFIFIAALFHWRCSKRNIHAKSVKTLLIALYSSMGLILIRCIYRLVEHTGNTKIDLDNLESMKTLSPILRYEVFFYIFEATFMLINSALWNIWNPGRFLPKDYHIYLSESGYEIEGEPDTDSRPLLAKAANVLTFGILYRRKRQTSRFRELDDYPPNRATT